MVSTSGVGGGIKLGLFLSVFLTELPEVAISNEILKCLLLVLDRDPGNSCGYINKAVSASLEVSLSPTVPLLTWCHVNGLRRFERRMLGEVSMHRCLLRLGCSPYF